jgi:HEAT repeat protein
VEAGPRVDTKELFGLAVLAWQAEPYDPDALDNLLIAIATPDKAAAVELARRHLEDEHVHLRGTAYRLLAVAAELGGEPVRSIVAGLAVAGYHAGEEDPDVLVGIVRALNGAMDERGLPVLVALAAHADVDVRHLVAASLPMVMGDLPEPAVIDALIRLGTDDDPDVRDWATFALGTLTDADSEAVRAALWARIPDSNAEARDEAVVALARRKDPRMPGIVADLLAEPSVGALIFQAAAHVADPALLALLRRFDLTDEEVLSAVQACEPKEQPVRAHTK